MTVNLSFTRYYDKGFFQKIFGDDGDRQNLEYDDEFEYVLTRAPGKRVIR